MEEVLILFLLFHRFRVTLNSVFRFVERVFEKFTRPLSEYFRYRTRPFMLDQGFCSPFDVFVMSCLNASRLRPASLQDCLTPAHALVFLD